MSWLSFAVLAYFIAAIVAILDKVILKVAIPRPVTYAAWIGIFGIYGLILVPFGFDLDPLVQNPLLIWLSLASGAIYIIGLYFLFSAVRINEVSRVSPLFGALTAVFTLIISSLFLIEKLDNLQLFAFSLLLLGGIIISVKFSDIRLHTLESIAFSVIGALLFAASFVLIKYVYTEASFLNGFIMGRLGEVLAGMVFLAISRKDVHQPLWEHLMSRPRKTVGLFILNKALGGVFFLFQNYAVFLGSVVLVQALSGTQYIFVLLLAGAASWYFPSVIKERISRKIVFVKATAILLIISGLVVLAFHEKPKDLAPGLKNFGVTFSKFRAEEIGLDWQKAYIAILDELEVKKIRIPAYWTDIEQSQGKISFSGLDWQLTEAGRRNAEIILIVGQRVPRWPECHIPDWAMQLERSEREKALLNVITKTVHRYKDNQVVKYWQVENEPFLSGFGICPKFDKDFLDRELELVRSIDGRPIILTDSGELSLWLSAAKRADIFGTTMYRIIWSNKIPGDGYLHYPLPPSFFHWKANLIKYFAKVKDIIVVELQAEPWGPAQTAEMPVSERNKSLSIRQFRENVEYAREVGFREVYLWGAEWWYWEKLNGRPEFWEYAKTLFSKK